MQRTEIFNAESNRILPVIMITVGVVAIIFAVTAGLLGISGQSSLSPNRASLALSGFVVLISGVILTVPVAQRRLAEWLLVIVGVVAAAFAADMVVIGGLPGQMAKHLFLASVIGGLLLTGVAPIGSLRGQGIRAWLGSFLTDRVKWSKFFGVLFQLGLLTLIIRQFELENQAFYHNLSLLIFYSFIIHYFLPAQLRLTYFLLISLAAILGVFGLSAGLPMIVFGLGLIAICHLPIPFIMRALLLLATGVVFALMHLGVITTSLSGAIWPVLAALFMFRLIAYMYDLKHKKVESNVIRTLSYFFLLPNIVFLLFPIVDYSNFRRTYYNEEEHQIYQTGVSWMLRGIFQLIVYRFVNYYLVISPQEIANVGDLVQYLVPNIMLLLRITGQFHLAIGILHLFGFNLPVTNDRYFLASGFTDFWRRANIYWKDFMVKVFYYPTYFRLRNLSDTNRLIVATLFAFFMTWILHFYQWFWLRGSLLLTAPDVLFWVFFAILVLSNSLYETKYGRRRSLGGRTWSFRQAALASLGTVATFTTITVLWSLWTSPSVPDFFSLYAVLGEPLGGIGNLTPLFLVVGALIGAKFYTEYLDVKASAKRLAKPVFYKTALVTGTALLAVFALGNPLVYKQFNGRPQEILADITQARLSDREAELLLRGYYEDLTNINSFNTELWDIYTKRPTDWPLLQDTELAYVTDDFYGVDLSPNASIMFHGARFSVNGWGMRDQSYELMPAQGTYRMALLGPSFVMGSGVADDETFEALIEKQANSQNDFSEYQHYELLNFGVAGHSVLQELLILEERVLAFKPDAVFLVSHQHEEEIAVRNLASLAQRGVGLPYDYFDELIQRAGITPEMTEVEAERRLQPYGRELVTWSYERIVTSSQEVGAVPVWIFLPTLEVSTTESYAEELKTLADEAGFATINLVDLYQGQDLDSLIVAAWDRHPNVRAHQLIAERLYNALQEQNAVIPLPSDD
ncbi:MAG: hypothetical protein IPM53_06650 [Anaerolineaceae bacterium]|nr:hypothetical protein [Anaerolineaceae bacterium]